MIGVVVYVAVDVVLQFLPPHYNPISEAESNLAVGPFGFIMNLNFLGRAVTSFATVGALLSVADAARGSRAGVAARPVPRLPVPRLLVPRLLVPRLLVPRLLVPRLPVPRLLVPRLLVPGLVLFALGGVCSAVLAFFPTDVAAAGERIPATTVTGSVHLVVATAGFVAALSAIVLLTAWIQRSGFLPAARRGAVVFTALAGVGLLFLALTVTVLPCLLGLAERLCLLGILGWTYWVARGIRRPLVAVTT